MRRIFSFMPLEVGSIVEGKVSGITNFGAFIQLQEGQTGLVHISEIAEEYVKDINNYLKENQQVKVKVVAILNGKISLSIKKALPPSQSTASSQRSSRPMEIDWGNRNNYGGNMSFEERMEKFKKDSDERLLDLKSNFEAKRGSGSYKRSAQF
jgi:S1 RNA binding domain protein